MTPVTHLLLAAGFGFPELLHAEIGYVAHPRLDVHARASLPLLQPALGLGVRGYVGALADERTPPRWAATAALDVSFNPAYPELFWGQERIGMAFWPMAGAQYLGDGGLLVRIEGGAVLGFEERPDRLFFGGGPNARVAVGFAR